MRALHMLLSRPVLTAAAVAVLIGGAGVAHAAGPMIDWDPAYVWQTGGTPTNLPAGGELKVVGIISHFDNPLGDLNANDPTKEYTFYVHGMTSLGTVVSGPPTLTLYETHYTGGTIEIYEDTTPEPATFAPNPPNATVPAYFTDGTLLLSGTVSNMTVQSNNFTPLQTGNMEGDITWTGGSLLTRTYGAGTTKCPGLFTGGITWRSTVVPAGYLFRHAGKIDLQCVVAAKGSTWGRLKQLYR